MRLVLPVLFTLLLIGTACQSFAAFPVHQLGRITVISETDTLAKHEPVRVPKKSNPFAVISFVLGMITVISGVAGVSALYILTPLCAVGAFTFGIGGLKKGRRNKGLAIIGLTVAIVTLIGFVFLTLATM